MALRPTKSKAPVALSIIGGIFGIITGMFVAFFGGALKTLVDKIAENNGAFDLGFLPTIGWVTLLASIAAIVGGSISKRTAVGGFILGASGIAVLVGEIVLCDRCYLFKVASQSSAVGVAILWVMIPGLLLVIGGLVAICAAFMKDKTAAKTQPQYQQPQGQVPPQYQQPVQPQVPQQPQETNNQNDQNGQN